MSEPTPAGPLFVAGPRRDHDLVFYSLTECAICRRAQNYLKEKGFAYRVLVVDQLAASEKDRLKAQLTLKHGVRPAFPALVVDDSRFLLGFFPKAWDEALGPAASMPELPTEGRGVQPIPEYRPAREQGAPPPGAVGRDLCGIKEVVRGINELEAELRRTHGLSLNEGLCLCCVDNQRRTPGECARQIGLSPSRISRILNSLEKKGLLERRSLPDDHRSTDLVLTDAGRQRLHDLRNSGFSFSRLDALGSRASAPFSQGPQGRRPAE